LSFWFGRSRRPARRRGRLHQSAAVVLAKAEVRGRIESTGMDATPSASPGAFAAEVAAEGPQLEKIIRGLGAKIE
jgi:hypothetical protein